MVDNVSTMIDEVDRRLVDELAASPRLGVLELSRRLGVARGTVQARLDKLVARGIITGFGPEIDPVALGYTVLAFTTIEIAQGRLVLLLAHLAAIPEVIEAHSTTGQGDLHLRVVARTNEHLSHVLNRILEAPGITRTTTVLALATQIPYRVLPLVTAVATGGGTPLGPGEPGPPAPPPQGAKASIMAPTSSPNG
jgi:DNA-binding Lrp family transcriptional regulator